MRAAPVPESAARRVRDWVRARILTGEYPGGVLLSEGEVAAALGVSRTPVREAFLQLEAQHMLALYPKRGALVLAVGTAELRDVVTARAVIEPWAAAEVTRRADRGAVVAELRRLTDLATRALADRQEAQFQEHDRAFHQCLLDAAGNQLLAGFYAGLRDRQVRGGSLALQRDPSRGDTTMAQHRSIADAIERGDPAVAAEAAAAHVHDTGRALGLHVPT